MCGLRSIGCSTFEGASGGVMRCDASEVKSWLGAMNGQGCASQQKRWQVSGNRYQVSGIRYQVSGIRYRIGVGALQVMLSCGASCGKQT